MVRIALFDSDMISEGTQREAECVSAGFLKSRKFLNDRNVRFFCEKPCLQYEKYADSMKNSYTF